VTTRDRILIGVFVAVVALGAFWMLALKPKRDQAAQLGRQLGTARQRLEQAQSTLSAGEAARVQYTANYAAVAQLGKAVPGDDNVPSLVYQLDSTANASGVDFRTVKLESGQSAGTPSSTTSANAAATTADNAKQGSAASGASGQTAGQSGSRASAATAAGTAAAPTQTATATLPPGAVVGPAGLSTMPFSFTFAGSFFRLSDFLVRLERFIRPTASGLDVTGRLLLINGISLSAGDGGFPQMKAAISATAYLAPPGQGTFNGATPAAPAGASRGQTVSAPGASAPTTTPPAVVRP
jgi:hypothetical protein